MRRGLQYTWLFAVAYLNLVALPPANRDWQPEDSIRVRYYLSDDVTWSTDRAHFFFRSSYGDLAHDTVVSELSIFSTKEILNALSLGGSASPVVKPIRKLVRTGGGYPQSSTRYPITFLNEEWSAEGTAINFQGQDERGIPQYYRYDVTSGVLQQLTSWNDDLAAGVAMQFERGVVVAHLAVAGPDRAPPEYPSHVITARELSTGWFQWSASSPRQIVTHVQVAGEPAWTLDGSDFDGASSGAFWFSPDCSKAVTLRRPLSPGPSWEAYGVVKNGKTDVPGFYLVDLNKKAAVPLLDAPAGEAIRSTVGTRFRGEVRAFWMSDNTHVVIVNTTLPFAQEAEKMQTDRRNVAYIVAVDVSDGSYEILERIVQQPSITSPASVVTNAGWIGSNHEFLVTHESVGRPANGTVYSFTNGKWTHRSIGPEVVVDRHAPQSPTERKVSVALVQNQNLAPRMIASAGGREIALESSDPALDGIWRADVQTFHWKEAGGSVAAGGLLLPRNAKLPVPLVIEAYAYTPKEFTVDGPARHAYAAQALVARGLAVLILDISDATGPKEWADLGERVNAASNALAALGYIDRSKVGMIGFSRAGFVTGRLVANPSNVPLAAAIIDDAFSATFSAYLALGGLGFDRKQFEEAYGGSFWNEKAAWLQDDSTMNMDQVRTPVLFTVHNQATLLNIIDLFGAYRLSGHPAEFLMFPQGLHNLSMPRQRLASYKATVDWLCYWLKDEIPADPDRAARWAILRKQQDEVLKHPPPPKGKWVFVPNAVQPAWTPPLESKVAGSRESSESRTEELTKIR